MKDLRDRVVVITGAGSGIGRATALAFARHGARVHLVDIDPDGVERVAGELSAQQRAARAATVHVLDCTDAAAVRQLAHTVYEADGRVDVLHNNAGVCCGGPVEQLSLDDWRWIVDINLWGVIHGLHAFLPRMIEQGRGGHIVNTASMAGLVGLPFVAPYCATKFAVVGLSEALAVELAVHEIQVTAVCTGAVRTRLMHNARFKFSEPWRERIHRLFDWSAADPEQTARRIVDTVRKERSLLIAPGHILPLWRLKRLSLAGYHRLARSLTAHVLRAGAGGASTARSGGAAIRP